ncbi:cytochrome d ubiquinol oxidase subunit II [Acuticoccus sp. M5D2P5]|uniref:cytochrome d ubiquinol oxidase subunit II n=1 Tax=Acuticoccus kalidii TaxID=2910977 RepID=UPI001F420EFE|nr:cytochrome d ubiquinol oxidase subunit II [Acuticoccus kalidii]
MDATSLPDFWALLIAFSIIAYVVLDGFDLGVGTLFGFTRDETDRRTLMHAIAPVWDGNETWLVLVGASLFGAFPIVYAIFLPAFYLPVVLLLIALVFRGVAFEFRYRAKTLRPIWDFGFCAGSILVGFVQGAAIGTMAQQLTVVDGQYAGGAFEWLNIFPVLCGIGLVLTYTLFGTTWVILKCEGRLRERAYDRLSWLVPLVVYFVVVAFLFSFNRDARVSARWLGNLELFVIPFVGLVAAWILLRAGRRRTADWVPFLSTIVFVVASYVMLVASYWPYMIPFTLTVEEAAAPHESLSFMFWGAGLVIFPIILIYTITVYLVFRGKVVTSNET